jgi:hypothetical protein
MRQSKGLLAAAGAGAGTTDIAIAHESSPYISVYSFTSGTGFGTKYSNPSTAIPFRGRGVAFSPSGNDIAVAHDFFPYVSVYPFTSGSGFGPKYSNPSTAIPGTGFGVAFSPSGNDIC